MPKYIVRNSQNIFDVAMNLYGTIEGLFDLLISNTDLDMSSELIPGTELEYHEEFVINPGIVNSLAENNIVVANGERSVYNKVANDYLMAIAKIPQDLERIEFELAGEGIILIDWGDNSPIEEINLNNKRQSIEHYFDNTVDSRRIKIYGHFFLRYLDLTKFRGDIFLTRPWIVDEFICQSNDNSLQGLFLFKNTYLVNLSGMVISDLSPIYDMHLQELDLRETLFPNPQQAIDDYLTYIKENHGNRRACKIYMDEEPSEVGMDAIQTIISEKEWNTPEKWEFHIKNKIYTALDGTDTNGDI